MENQKRRSFLKLGAVGALVLATGGLIYRQTHRAAGVEDRFLLQGEARTVLAAIVPALLGSALPLEAAARQAAIKTALDNTQQAISGLPFHAQKEIGDLFGLLALAPARRLLTGMSQDWAQAPQAEVARFLQEWRTHKTETLQTAYHALHDLVIGPWYGNSAVWASIGYPGPIKELSQ